MQLSLAPAAPILPGSSGTIGTSDDEGIPPSGNVFDQAEIQGKKIDVITDDVANICIFTKAEDFGITCHERAATLTEDRSFVALIKKPRGKASQLVGMRKDWGKLAKSRPSCLCRS